MGNIDITFLGTGTSQGIPVIACPCEVCHSKDPRDTRWRTSCLIEIQDKTFCIDAGPDFRMQMLKHDVQKLDAIFVSHAHRDHVGGLDDIRSFNYLQGEGMPIYGNKYALESIKRDFAYAFDAKAYPGIPKLELIEMDKDIFPVEVCGQEVIPIGVFHYKLPILGYRIGNFTYITDAKTFPDHEIDKLRNSKVLVLNALRKSEHFSHLTLQEALDIIEEVKPETAYLTHISHYLGTHEEISKELPHNVHLAYDGLKISL